MNKELKKYPGQPGNEIWFYDKDMPYYELTNFYYNEESRKGSGVVGLPQYPIFAKLPLQSKIQAERILPFDENGKINEARIAYYINFCKESLVSKETNDIFPSQWGRIVSWKGSIKEKRWDESIEGGANVVFENSKNIKWGTAEHLFQALKFTSWETKNDKVMGIDKGNYSVNMEYLIKEAGGFFLVDVFTTSTLKAIEYSLYDRISDSEKKELKVNWYLDAIRSILKDPDPKAVRGFANLADKDFIRRKDWHGEMKIRAMKWVVREKFNQNPKLRKLLWETGDKKLVEHSPHDSFWGDGGNGKGENHLGKILMEVRTEVAEAVRKWEWVPSEVEEPKATSEADKERNNQSLIEKNIQEIKDKLSRTGISSEKEIEILGSLWETDYRRYTGGSKIERRKKELLEKIGKFTAKISTDGNHKDKEKKKNNFSKISEEQSSQQQINEVKDKLNQVQESNNEEDIIRVLKETSETIKNSGDENLKKQKEEAERKLSKDKLREIVREEIKQELTENGIKPDELTSTVKQKLDELNNNNNNNNDQDTRTEVFNEIGKQKLLSLISALKQALKSGQKSKVENKLKELQQFISSKTDYKQNAYKKEKDKVEKLLGQAQSQLGQKNENNQEKPFFRVNNPVIWISGVAFVGLIGIVLIVKVHRKKKVGNK